MSSRSLLLGAAAVLAIGIAPAQAQQPSPEQRIERLERQLQQVQRQVFPRGAPAATAGFSDEPAATQTSVRNLDERLNALERQLADILRQSEENGHRASEVARELDQLRSDQDRRLTALESAAQAAAIEQAPAAPAAPATKSKAVELASTPEPKVVTIPTEDAAAEDPAELVYDEGYELWRAGKYDEAISSLRDFSKQYPKHRRASWANNLTGRAQLDKHEPRAAAATLLANYRNNPKGERAADSLYYLGQALMELNQAGQACKVYAELEDVYGSSMRAELKRLLPGAKSEAKCS
jgi:TolA-binding protein